MKTRYIFTAITAALTLLMTGCQKEADHYLDEIKKYQRQQVIHMPNVFGETI